MLAAQRGLPVPVHRFGRLQLEDRPAANGAFPFFSCSALGALGPPTVSLRVGWKGPPFFRTSAVRIGFVWRSTRRRRPSLHAYNSLWLSSRCSRRSQVNGKYREAWFDPSFNLRALVESCPAALTGDRLRRGLRGRAAPPSGCSRSLWRIADREASRARHHAGQSHSQQPPPWSCPHAAACVTHAASALCSPTTRPSFSSLCALLALGSRVLLAAHC